MNFLLGMPMDGCGAIIVAEVRRVKRGAGRAAV
jgi:hypothetical protein